MTNHVARLYVVAGSLLAFFLAWAGIAAHPWADAGNARAERAQAAAQYELRLRRDAALLRQLSAPGVATSAPPVRVVTLPPLTTTRTS